MLKQRSYENFLRKNVDEIDHSITFYSDEKKTNLTLNKSRIPNKIPLAEFFPHFG